ncbi:DNA-binding protein [Zychaea mexicana]|uniref:DNA-binding protein n=1 Tax=Zychaea mexicana TaxID=64656 RepID=UPI0022FF0776|nr:DNA-binding protein [Zychaea mexicana]KAI9496572.1 DNA-binding protein [Zychaea mexicana]
MLTRQDLVNLLLDFIDVWIHQILYERDLYPAAIFSLKRKYDVPVHIAAHEGVASYVSEFVESLKPLVRQGNCKRIALKIIAPSNNRLLERFVFEIDSALRALDVPIDTVLDSEATCSLADVQQQLRACLLRMTATRSTLSSNPPDCTFTLTVETYSGPPQDQGRGSREDYHVDWIPSSSAQEGIEVAGEQQHRWNSLIPIKTIPMDLFKVNVFVMEAVKKGKHISR